MEIDHPRRLKKTVKKWLFNMRRLRPLERRRLVRMFNRERRLSGLESLRPNRRITLIDLP